MAVAMQQSMVMSSTRSCARVVRPMQQHSALRTSRFIVRATSETQAEPASAEENKPEPPKQKNAWELIEEPVRGSPPDGGRPVPERNNEIDNTLINYDGADERALTGLPISWPDVFRFKGVAPEIINCRLAMLGAFAGLTAEVFSGKSIVEQYRVAPGPIAGVFLLIAVASLIPISKGVARKSAGEFGSPLTFLTSELEVNVGRVAMLGIFGTILTEAVIGHAVL